MPLTPAPSRGKGCGVLAGRHLPSLYRYRQTPSDATVARSVVSAKMQSVESGYISDGMKNWKKMMSSVPVLIVVVGMMMIYVLMWKMNELN